jgi:hypothetical protein
MEKARTFAASRAAQQLAAVNRELDAVKGRLANVAARGIANAYQQGLLVNEKQDLVCCPPWTAAISEKPSPC